MRTLTPWACSGDVEDSQAKGPEGTQEIQALRNDCGEHL